MNKRIVALFVSVSCILAIFFIENASDLWSSISSIDFDYVFLAIVVLILNVAVVAFRLKTIMGHFGVAISMQLALRANASGLVAGLLMINMVGAIVGRHLVLRGGGISASMVALVAGYERLVLALVAGGLALSGALNLVGRDLLSDLFGGLPVGFLLLALFTAAAVVFATGGSKFERDLRGSLLHPRRGLELLEICVTSLASQLLNTYVYVLMIEAMGYDVDLFALISAAAMVGFAASLPISVNGWGVREVASVYAFGLLGVPSADALAASIVVGVLNTAVVLVMAPFIFARRSRTSECAQNDQSDRSDKRALFPLAKGSGVGAGLDFQKLFALSAGLSIGILLFFQFPLNIQQTTLTVNLGDPIALLAFGLVCAQFLFSRTLPFELGRSTIIWLASVSAVILISLCVGIYHFGPTPWALGNRGVGLLVILGYFVCGAMLAGQFGAHGTRRLAQVLLTAASAVVVVHLLQRWASGYGIVDIPVPFNFEGFSANRNAFAYQLLTTFVMAAVFLIPAKHTSANGFRIGAAIVMAGVFFTGSITGLLAVGLLLSMSFFCERSLRNQIFMTVAAAYGLHLLLPYVYVGMPAIVSSIWAWFDLSPIGVDVSTVLIADARYNESSVTERLESLWGGLKLWREHPILGAGLGAFISTATSTRGAPLVIHSTYIWLLAEAGVLGVLLTIAVPLQKLRGFWHSYRKPAKLRIGGFSTREAGLLFVLAVFALFSLTHEIAYQRIFWLALGAVLASPATHRQFGARNMESSER